MKIELEDPLENVGVKLVRQAGARTNDLAGDGSTTSVVLAHGLITEGLKVRKQWMKWHKWVMFFFFPSSSADFNGLWATV